MSRNFINWDWVITRNASGNVNLDGATIEVLMDIRQELRDLNAVLHCHRFQNIPSTLDTISRKLTKEKKGETCLIPNSCQ